MTDICLSERDFIILRLKNQDCGWLNSFVIYDIIITIRLEFDANTTD